MRPTTILNTTRYGWKALVSERKSGSRLCSTQRAMTVLTERIARRLSATK